MKKIVYGIITVIVLFLGITVTFQNQHVVDFNYYFGLHWKQPLAWILLLTFFAGIVAGFLASLKTVVRLQRQLVRGRKELRRAEQEVSNLRALPIKDVV
ncbi:MAG: hypothetical protein BMS9Abin10_0602 [Gammaproteobacteria bacterium]|nr:MAG: hypothetical protein BMS9Abin10_0602 [Gammaproteobacteria bacterium]